MEKLLEYEIMRLCKFPRSFGFLSSNLYGCDLTKLKEILDSLVEQNRLQCIEDQYLIKQGGNGSIQLFSFKEGFYLQKYMGHFDFLKKPHPLDYEWRNSTKTLDDICDYIIKDKLDEEPILILGMPTLFARLCQRGIGIKVVLFERNKPIVKALKAFTNDRFLVYEADISSTEYTSDKRFFSVFIDPPWYTEPFKSFIWLASKYVEIGGLVHISIPSINTRPGIAEERIDWFTYCHNSGLCIEVLKPQTLEYVMPFFEFNAYRSVGIEEISPFWRKGDLLIFRKINAVEIERPKQLQTEDSTWREIEIDEVRIRIAMEFDNQYQNGELKIIPLVKNDILDSVSKRDMRRKNANVWTSGNRVYNVTNPNLFFQLLSQYQLDTQSISTHRNGAYIEEFLSNLVKIENKEYSIYLKWLFDEMERYSS